MQSRMDLILRRQLELSEKAQVYAWAKEPGGIPLIWENAYGDGKFVVDNFGLYEKAVRGFYAASYSLLTDIGVYPVINGSAFYLMIFHHRYQVVTGHMSNEIMGQVFRNFIRISGGRIC